jgi:hypothetical protein
MEPILLSRDEFRKQVFERDGGKCLFCPSPAADAHHIMERRLFPDGGYYADNGASVCEPHHMRCEMTEISTDEVREKAGIAQVVLPPHLYDDDTYDKWGNIILPNGQRIRGELFDDLSVQKVLAPVLHLFTNRVKYPRTFHLPWSPGVGKNDRIMTDLSGFEDEEVIVTIKMDGEQTTMYSDYVHARSLEWHPHASRTWVKTLHARVGYNIPQGWRVCGENLYARHSIPYSNLKDYFQVFSIWNEKNECLSWDETVEYTAMLELNMVPTFERLKWDRPFIQGTVPVKYAGDPCEGYVVRVARSFHYREFRRVVGKYVRAGHVQTHGHWMKQAVIPNELGKGSARVP